MNSVREIQRINERELELGLHGSGSWHDQYKDSAYIYVGGLHYDMTEGDVLTIFSQYGEIVHIHLPKPRSEPDTQKPKGHNRGFGFLMYEDQRSTVLAVDNLNGTQVLGRTLRVDHVAHFQPERVRDAQGHLVEPDEQVFNCAPPETVVDDEGGEDDELEDPMAAYLSDKRRRHEKRRDERHRHRRHRHHRHHRHRDDHEHDADQDRDDAGEKDTHSGSRDASRGPEDRSRSATPVMDRRVRTDTP